MKYERSARRDVRVWIMIFVGLIFAWAGHWHPRAIAATLDF